MPTQARPIPESVTISGQMIHDVLVKLYGVEESVSAFCGYGESRTIDLLTHATRELFTAAFGDPNERALSDLLEEIQDRGEEIGKEIRERPIVPRPTRLAVS